MDVTISGEKLNGKQKEEALTLAKQGLAIGVAALVIVLIKWIVIGFGLFF